MKKETVLDKAIRLCDLIIEGKITRNEVRRILGLKGFPDPKADTLINSGMKTKWKSCHPVTVEEAGSKFRGASVCW